MSSSRIQKFKRWNYGLLPVGLILVWFASGSSLVFAQQQGTCHFKCKTQQVEHLGTCQGIPDCSTGCESFCLNIGDTCDGATVQCEKTETLTVPSSTQTPATPAGRYGLKDPLEGANIPKILGGVIRYAVGFVGALFLLFFMYGGFLWMTAGGDMDRIKKAKKTLSYALLGIAVVILSYTLLGLLISYSAQLSVPS